ILGSACASIRATTAVSRQQFALRSRISFYRKSDKRWLRSFALELNAVAQIVDLQKTNMPIAAPNISRVASETTITLGIELGWSFITVRSTEMKTIPTSNTGARRPLMTALQ